ncbi:hypothetical protein GcM1_c13850o119 [Golovinomyces cichoracearum]|uniref:Uncharacterized protein n=1 Tax=Golovinomyces cichoracearum TaxID=62708 RepID=A0A420IAP6_9PEZI|nr:hypothetical protein GcM1_c13850o119 [Golovinomyces cichoracearum]
MGTCINLNVRLYLILGLRTVWFQHCDTPPELLFRPLISLSLDDNGCRRR